MAWNYIHYGIFVQDIVDLFAVVAGNDALGNFLEVTKLSKSWHFAQYLRPPSSELQQILTDASHMRHTELHQVQWTLVHFP